MNLKTGGLWRSLTDHTNPSSLSSRMRQRRMAHIEDLIRTVHARKGMVSILDIGGEEAYWHSLLPVIKATNTAITVLNLTKRGETSGPFIHVAGDGCNLDYPDRSFDLAHSNSVIEHVGDWEQMRKFARETRRVGDAYFVQTPAYGFPMEPHFGVPGFQWLPRNARIAMLQRFACGHYTRCGSIDEAADLVDHTQLLSLRQMRVLFADADYVPEKMFGLTKSFMFIRQPELRGGH